MWNPSNDEALAIIGLLDTQISEVDLPSYIRLIPTLYDVGCAYCNNTFDMSDGADRLKQSSMKLFIAKSIQYLSVKTVGLVGEKMGTVSYSYSETMPVEVYEPLKPFKKLRW